MTIPGIFEGTGMPIRMVGALWTDTAKVLSTVA